MLTPREKSPLPEISPEEDRTPDAVDSEPKHYQRAVLEIKKVQEQDLDSSILLGVRSASRIHRLCVCSNILLLLTVQTQSTNLS